MSAANLKKIALAANLILSCVIALLIGVPSFTPARSVPGGECYEACRNLTFRIISYNDQVASGNGKGKQLHVFTETPENIAFVQNEPSINFNFRHAPECVYGTVGDLSEDGFIVCRHHGSYNDSPESKNLEATFFLPDKGIVKVKGLQTKTEFSRSFKRELRFSAVLIVFFAFLVTFSSISVLLKLFFPSLSLF